MKKEIIDKYGEESFKVYEQEGLICLSDNDCQWQGRNSFECPNNPSYNEDKFENFVNLSDIHICSEDLKFFTGQLFLYREYINNPLNELICPFGNNMVSTYHQNYYDRRYSMFITCCFEKAYNFWDRIGDRIASFFPELIKIKNVDFSRVIDKLSKEDNIDSENFNWLLEFRNSEYRILNQYRRDMVHYYQYEANYRFQHSMNNMDFDKLKELWDEKSEFPKFFKNHLEYTAIGYFKMIDFLNEQTEKN